MSATTTDNDSRTVKTRTRISIVSTLIARELLELVRASMPTVGDEPPQDVSLERDGVGGRGQTWRVRYSSVYHTLAGQRSSLFATGGILITVRLQAPSWGGGWNRAQYQARLRPGWTERQFKLAVARAELWARERTFRTMASERLYALQDRITDDDMQAIEQIERETGRETTYGLMSEEDANFWVQLLRARHPEWQQTV